MWNPSKSIGLCTPKVIARLDFPLFRQNRIKSCHFSSNSSWEKFSFLDKVLEISALSSSSWSWRELLIEIKDDFFLLKLIERWVSSFILLMLISKLSGLISCSTFWFITSDSWLTLLVSLAKLTMKFLVFFFFQIKMYWSHLH